MNTKKLFINLVILILIITTVNAATKDYCVTAEVSDISPSSIGINEEFTIGIQIENCGNDMPEYVTFELLNPPADITISESLIINISKLYYGNSERLITYHMRTKTNAQVGTHLIKARLNYGTKNTKYSKNYEINFNVIGNKGELNIASLKTKPVLPKEGEIVELTMRIENTGDGTAKSVEVYLDHTFPGLKQSFIGALDSNEDGPAILTFIPDKPGEFTFPVTISYKDDFGVNEIKTNVNLNILEKESNFTIIIISILVLVVFIAIIYYFFKTKKAKNKIIQQLLQGNHSDKKNKK